MCERKARNGRLIARTILQQTDVYLCVFVWFVFVENAQEMVMMIGSRRGMQHDDVVKRKSRQETQRMYVQENPKRNKQECENGNDVCAKCAVSNNVCVCARKRAARDDRKETPTKRLRRKTQCVEQ